MSMPATIAMAHRVGRRAGWGRGSVAAYDGGRPIQDAARLWVRDGFRRGLPWIRGGATV